MFLGGKKQASVFCHISRLRARRKSVGKYAPLLPTEKRNKEGIAVTPSLPIIFHINCNSYFFSTLVYRLFNPSITSSVTSYLGSMNTVDAL